MIKGRTENRVEKRTEAREVHDRLIATGPEMWKPRNEAVSPSGAFRLRWMEGWTIAYPSGKRMGGMGLVELAEGEETVLRLARELPYLGTVIDTGRFAIVERRVRHFGSRLLVFERDGGLLHEWHRAGPAQCVCLSTCGRWLGCTIHGDRTRTVRVFDVHKGSFVPDVRTMPKASAAADVASDGWELLLRSASGEAVRVAPEWHQRIP